MNKHFIYQVWASSGPALKILILSLVIILTLKAIAYFVRYILFKKTLEAFLYNNSYHSEDFRSKQIKLPNVTFKNDRIEIRNCLTKTKEQVESEKELWQRAFSSKIKGKKIGLVETHRNLIRMALV